MEISNYDEILLINAFRSMNMENKSIFFQMIEPLASQKSPAKYELIFKASNYISDLIYDMSRYQYLDINRLRELKDEIKKSRAQLIELIAEHFKDRYDINCSDIKDIDSLYDFLIESAAGDKKTIKKINKIYDNIFINRWDGAVSGYRARSYER